MANEVEKLNSIAIADIEKVNGKTDDNIEAFNGFEFANVTEWHSLLATPLNITTSDTAVSAVAITTAINWTAYDIYQFQFIDFHPETQHAHLQFQVSASDNAGGYDEHITSTYFHAEHSEDGGTTNLAYSTGYDQANGQAYQTMVNSIDNENEDSLSGNLFLFKPSSGYVKHFFSRFGSNHHSGEYSSDSQTGGYIDEATDIDEIRFKFSTGDIHAGKIKVFGIIK